ncbi:Cna B-type domain-containing protein [Phocea massiliensis]|uniref:Cna B-type domain-containing protein n=1 Tax=Merdimmobilis hominis TaxID=2897707 RepID=A0A939BDN3_9FIRM|nr:Cna B-type domain-containing protein [Merdimmobilis hominis]MBM6920081.1 Cna B-type domain-containing protein [Merdimmobilis hominis]
MHGLSTVTAVGDYAGGIAGSLGTASVTGLLNGTLGVGNFLGFTLSNTEVTGCSGGYHVTAVGDYAGGAIGLATGGTASNVVLSEISSVAANNRAGGFVGCAGPGDLAGSNGLKLGLLGIELLELKNLLSVAEGVRVQISDCHVTGIQTGLRVSANASNNTSDVTDFAAGGFIGKSNSTQITRSHVSQLNSVTAPLWDGFAGGYVGTSQTGGLAEVAEEDNILKLIQLNQLLGTVTYLIPSYTDCTVRFIDGGYTEAQVAGGFAGEMQSGKVNNAVRGESDWYAVYNIDHVNGQTYGGGFAGIISSGALADAGGGISILGGIDGLNINLSDLLALVEAYVPYVQYAGVKSDNGFTVVAKKFDEIDIASGSAGGFVGYASGAQISYCDVQSLKHTTVTPPDDLEAVEAPSYFDSTQSTYAVTGGRYAGGFVGNMNIGSAASVGGGLKVLGSSIQLSNVLDVLSVVVTTIEHSDVTGSAGGYSVLASAVMPQSHTMHGMAGGYAGAVYGGHIQDSHANLFEYVIGQIAAGGYVGEMMPGDAARLMENVGVFDALVSTDTALASLVQTFIPTIRNSTTDCVPCGGAVRAQAFSDEAVQRGMAGGYVGHNMGGSIWGLNTDSWKSTQAYAGPISLCTADRIRSVYGAEYAGGYVGLMESADTASTGGVSLLEGLVSVNNILGALSVVYPTQENTAVYGPLANLDLDTWNRWVEYVGIHGGYGYTLSLNGKAETQQELEDKLKQYIYGFHVVAGRSEADEMLARSGGDAGGYVGLMCSGTLTSCMAYDVKLVSGWHAAGGFAGQMQTGGAADFGNISILGLNLNVGQLIKLAEVFVPAVKHSSVQGYTSGMTVQSTGLVTDDAGYAGGYVGCSYGAQIQLNSDGLPSAQLWQSTEKYPAPLASCDVRNLRRVTGRNAVGGYVGLASAASLASVNTNASDGLLQGILDHVITSAANLVDLLPATVTTIHKASVSPADEAWGFVVSGAYTTDNATVQYAPYAGGFAGYIQAAVLGERDAAGDMLAVTGLHSVDGGLYAGGFFGLADTAAVAEISGTNAEGATTDILGALINLGSVDALDVLRTYIYHASVQGIKEGYTVQAHTTTAEGIMDEKRQTGCAGGFGGGLLNGTIRNSAASGLSTVRGCNYTGGFVGHMGKSGVVDIDSAEILAKLLGATVGALDLFGSQVYDSSVQGYAMGAVIEAAGGEQPIAGGFVGYSDLGRIDSSHATQLKKVTSEQVAGGFIGQTDMNYIVSAQIQSVLLEAVLQVVNELLEALYLNDTRLESINLGDLNLGILEVELLSDGNTLKVELLGLPITVALSKQADNPDQQTDIAIVTIGDSVVRLPCSEQDGVKREDLENAEINLIKGNRTELNQCTVTGVNNGYDVFGGGASQDADGTHPMGISGGFVGYNHEGKLSNCTMIRCDVVRGTADRVGPFSGYNDLKSVYDFNTITSIEGNNNRYSIYRPFNSAFTQVILAGGTAFASAQQDTSVDITYNRYDVTHLALFDTFNDLKGALETGKSNTQRELLVYVSAAKAVLMMDANAPDNPQPTTPEPGQTADPCEDTVDLTINKIWDDWGNFDGLRPGEIKIDIYQQKFAPDGKEIGEQVLYRTITLTTEDLVPNDSNLWRKIVADLPVIEYESDEQGAPTDQVKAYYIYSFEEQAVAGYTETLGYNEGIYEVTITNHHDPELPDVGGIGSLIFVVVGVGILLPALLVRKRRGGRKEGA